MNAYFTVIFVTKIAFINIVIIYYNQGYGQGSQ